MPQEENIEDSKKCLNIGRSAFQMGNLIKAERFVLKSDRLCPNDDAKAFLIEVRAAMLDDKENKRNDFTRNSKTEINSSLEADRDEADKCIRVALKAINAGNFVKAKRFLEKAEKIYPTDQAKVLLKQVTSEDPKKHGSKDHTRHKKKYKENNEEAFETCIDIAQQALDAGDYDKALRFLNKSEQFGDDLRVKNLLAQVLAAKGKDDANGTKEKKTKVPKDKPKKKPPPEKQEEPRRTVCTEEQLSTILRVKGAKDDYEILGVPQNADRSIIKSAKLRLIALLHPDKNPAPEAHEIFMIVNAAIQRLTRPKKGTMK